jgi:probable rRNA maturation factor
MERWGKQKSHGTAQNSSDSVNVVCINAQDALHIDEDQVERLVSTFLNWKKVECDEIIIHFVNKKKISQLHGVHFQDPSPTDCISFPIDSPDEKKEGYTVLGEVFVCPQVGVEYTQKHQLNPHDEISLYIVHGLLHLLGYDDQDKQSLTLMRQQETLSLSYLKENKAVLHA